MNPNDFEIFILGIFNNFWTPSGAPLAAAMHLDKEFLRFFDGFMGGMASHVGIQNPSKSA